MAIVAAIVVYLAATCTSESAVEACDPANFTPEEAAIVDEAVAEAQFQLMYPCYLPNAQRLESAAVTGDPGRQSVSFVWVGPFEFTIRQSQFPPAVSPDPSGASRVIIDLFPNTRATLIERNDATEDALYHLFWSEDEIYYELQAFGPPQQRRITLQIARSLEPLEEPAE